MPKKKNKNKHVNHNKTNVTSSVNNEMLNVEVLSAREEEIVKQRKTGVSLFNSVLATLLGGLCCTLFFILLFQFIFGALGYTNETIKNSNIVYCIYSSGAMVGYAVFILAFLFIKSKKNKQYYGDNSLNVKTIIPAGKLKWQVVLICIVLAILALFMLNGFVSMVTNGLQGLGYSKSDGLPFKVDNVYNYILYLVFFCALPALLEEFLYRGIIQGGLLNSCNNKSRVVLAIFIGALVFALSHQSAQQFVFPLIMGSIFGLIYYFTGNIWYSVITHFASNALVVTINFIGELTHSALLDKLTDFSVAMCFVYIVIALAFIPLAFALLKTIRKLCKGTSCFDFRDEENVREKLIYEKAQETSEELKYTSSDGIIRYRASRKENDRLAFVMGIIVLVLLFGILIADLITNL